MPLTDTAIRNAKHGKKSIRLFDGGGLYLEISPSGGKWWRFKYRFDAREKRLSLGVYPDVPLAGRKDKKTGEWINGARDKRDKARQLLADGIDPGEHRKIVKEAKVARAENSFEAVAREWFESTTVRQLQPKQCHRFAKDRVTSTPPIPSGAMNHDLARPGRRGDEWYGATRSRLLPRVRISRVHLGARAARITSAGAPRRPRLQLAAALQVAACPCHRFDYCQT